MLHAINLNKAGRNLTAGEVHWRQLFTTSEDSLTSSVLGAMLYLPTELFWRILNASINDGTLVNSYPQILSYEFWPHWDPSFTKNTNFIEPDVFIKTPDFDLIIEAKRNGFGKELQCSKQWDDEVHGYLNEFDLNREVFVLAIDGLKDKTVERRTIKRESVSKTFEVFKCNWSEILHQVKLMANNFEKKSLEKDKFFILKDIIMAFSIHGFSTGTWFDEQDFSNMLNVNSNQLNDILKIRNK